MLFKENIQYADGWTLLHGNAKITEHTIKKVATITNDTGFALLMQSNFVSKASLKVL